MQSPGSGSAPFQNVSESDPADWIGKVFGEYEILSLVGQGGNGQVYRAQHRWLKVPVAIKSLRHINPDDESSLERFQREAQIAARLRHPNIVRCTDGGVLGDKLFLVTDYVDGMDLRKLVRQHGVLSVPDACELIRQTAIALQFIVDNDTIHRDIKPANIMLDGDGTVRVLDMGLARSAINSETLTETGQVMGTLDYIAPEQAVDSRCVDFRADLYSLGCTFYFLLTGQAPFATDDNETAASKLLAHLEADHPPIKQFRRDVPRSVIDLIDQMLRKSPEYRPNSFDTICNRLQTHAKPHQVKKLISKAMHAAPGAASVPQKQKPRFSHRAGDFISSVTKTVFRSLMVGLGFLERAPTSRPGQRAHYRFSFRWLLALSAIGAIGYAVSYTDFDFSPAKRVPAIETTSSNQPTNIGQVSHSPTNAQPTPIEVHDRHAMTPPSHTAPRNPPPKIPPGPMMHHPPQRRLSPPPHPPQPGPVRSQGVRFNEFQQR